MRHLIPVCMTILSLASAPVCSAAYAETITALAVPVNPEHPEKTASHARILGCSEERNTLTVELIAPEIFAEEDIRELAAGDAIYTDGEEVRIQSIDRYEEDGYLVINEGKNENAPGSVRLRRDRRGSYMAERCGQPIYNTLAVIECPIRDTLLFLDYTGAETGGAPDLPIVSTAAEFAALIRDGFLNPGLDNVCVVFDGDGQLAAVHRLSVPPQ